MTDYKDIFVANENWRQTISREHPDFFQQLATPQHPRFLWIGCADSRVPSNTITGLDAGELFVHRNIANVVSHTDLNILAVLEYAIHQLEIEDIIVCGHYGCGGVNAAVDNQMDGLLEHWLRGIRDCYHHHHDALAALPGDAARRDAMCELNVALQVNHVCRTPMVSRAWGAGRSLTVHGLIFGLHDGRLQELGLDIANREQAAALDERLRHGRGLER